MFVASPRPAPPLLAYAAPTFWPHGFSAALSFQTPMMSEQSTPFVLSEPSPPPQPVASAAEPSSLFAFASPPLPVQFGPRLLHDNAANPFAFDSSSTSGRSATPGPAPRESKYAPLLRKRTPEEARVKRRDEYMRQVRERGDVKRYEARGEMSLQRDFLEEQRVWEAAQAHAAQAWEPIPEDYEEMGAAEDDAMDFMTPDGYDSMDEFGPEHYEFGGMDFSQPPDAQDPLAPTMENKRAPSAYDSDDEEYEMLMLEIATQAERQRVEVDKEQGMDMAIE